jgi:pyruvate,orthophosphate dikinase
MPGMMDTVLNLGLNDTIVEGLAKQAGNERFALDCYRRLLQMFGDVVLGIEHDEFEHEIVMLKKKAGVKVGLTRLASFLGPLGVWGRWDNRLCLHWV